MRLRLSGYLIVIQIICTRLEPHTRVVCIHGYDSVIHTEYTDTRVTDSRFVSQSVEMPSSKTRATTEDGTQQRIRK